MSYREPGPDEKCAGAFVRELVYTDPTSTCFELLYHSCGKAAVAFRKDRQVERPLCDDCTAYWDEREFDARMELRALREDLGL